MAKIEQKRGYVSGFVRGYKETKHDQISFKVCGRRFLVPKRSIFAGHVQTVHKHGLLILIVFEEAGHHPKIEGMVNCPLWAEVAAAARGASISEVHRAGAAKRHERAGSKAPD
jgi:hypothetical protein